MLRGGQPIQLEKGQEIIVEAVGAKYIEWEGYKEEHETRIGLSYARLCQSVVPGGKILLADGTIMIEVLEILSDTELRGRVCNSKELGQRKNGNLPGVKVRSSRGTNHVLWVEHRCMSLQKSRGLELICFLYFTLFDSLVCTYLVVCIHHDFSLGMQMMTRVASCRWTCQS